MKSVNPNHSIELSKSGFLKPTEGSINQSCSEREIWLDFKDGSDSALSYIYRNYANHLFNYGCQINKNEELVRDCIQDLFIDIIRNRKKLANVNAIKFYLFTSLRRKIIRKLVKHRNHPTETINNNNEVQFEVISSPEAIMINEQLTDDKCNILNSACQKLTVKQRESILLYFYEGFSYKQVAEIMGMSKVKSTRILIYRALNVLENVLTKVKDQLFLPALFFINSFL